MPDSQFADSLFDLAGKVALVTGSTRGIGKSIAEELARAGARVVVSSRKKEACEALRAEFEARGWPVLAQPCNVSDRDALRALVERTLTEWGRIDIAVANAGANPHFGPLAGLPDEAFDKVFANNVKSALWLANLTLPAIAAQGGGSFIAIGSVAGVLANTSIGAYGMSKAALHHLVKNLAAEWGPKNVRVNAIAPGLIRTDFARALWEDARRRAEREQMTPLRRLGEPIEVANAVLFLASDDASFVTAAELVVDGGFIAQ